VLECCAVAMSDASARNPTLAPPLEGRSCPSCGSSSRTEALSREGGYELVRCRDCRMLYTHRVQTIAGKILHYDKLVRERVDTTSTLSPAHYGLANQIKSVPLYTRVLQFVAKAIPEGNINFVGWVVLEDYFCSRHSPWTVTTAAFRRDLTCAA
jgi:hypothetical protein